MGMWFVRRRSCGKSFNHAMSFFDWVITQCPGTVSQLRDRIEVAHENGDFSTFWLPSRSATISPELIRLGDPYCLFDGIDLFSSSFKFASSEKEQAINGVALTPTIHAFADLAANLQFVFPEPATIFMTQSGIWYYAVAKSSGRIFEWDSEQNELSGEYASVIEIISEWLEAVREQA
jgi:hypothetical protein